MILRHGLVPLLAIVIIGCSAEVTPSSPAPSPSATNRTEPTPGQDASPSKDAGTDSGSTSAPAKLENDASQDVTAIDEMTFDFGAGKKVALNQPACQGTFPIAAGAAKTIEVRMVVSASGEVSPAGFSMKCPTSQSFGAGDGTAPTDASFSSPIAIRIEGTTRAGTFSAAGVAARAN